MLMRLIKMITKVKENVRIREARNEFKNRHIKNRRLAMYQQKKMLEISKQLREKLNQDTNPSGDGYFAVLKEIYNPLGQTVYSDVIKKYKKSE